MEEQMEMVGRAFVEHYYHLLDVDRPSLSSLYQPTSMLSFEGQRIQGVDDICGKLNQLPFEQCHHVISTIDTQPSSLAGGMMVFVSGSLQLPGEDHPLRFSQQRFSFSAAANGIETPSTALVSTSGLVSQSGSHINLSLRFESKGDVSQFRQLIVAEQ